MQAIITSNNSQAIDNNSSNDETSDSDEAMQVLT